MMSEEVERLRDEYRRKYGREHPKSCEEADPSSPCVCGCGGALHGMARRLSCTSSITRVTLEKWMR